MSYSAASCGSLRHSVLQLWKLWPGDKLETVYNTGGLFCQLSVACRALSQLEGDQEMYSLLLKPLELLMSQQANYSRAPQDSNLSEIQQLRAMPRRLRFLTGASATQHCTDRCCANHH